MRRAAGRVLLKRTLGRWLTPDYSFAEQRKRVDRLGRAAALPRGTKAERVDLGGVPADRVELGITDPRRAIILSHSGGFTVNNARGQRPLAALLSRAAGAPVFSLDYRLAPEHPYPAQIEDLMAAYGALCGQGFEPGSIAFAGDSAGGNLSLSVAMRLRDAGEPLPAALLLMCPILDYTHTGESGTFNAGKDPVLSRGWELMNDGAYLAGHDPADPAVSPLWGDLSGLPPIHLQSAGEDLLLSDSDRLEERVRAAGGRIEHRREPEIWHDFQAMPALSGAAGRAIRDGGDAIRRAWEAEPGNAQARRVAIIGAGFGGIGLGLRLKQAGIENFEIFDREEGLGGTWRANTYPGAACDVPAHFYSFSDQPNPDWSRAYAPQPEILAYLEGVAEDNDIVRHIRFGTQIERAEWDDAAGIWRLHTGSGEVREAEIVVSAVGQLGQPRIPAIPGAEGFAGPSFHTARWDHEAEIDGRRIGVVGTGASAIQVVPAIAERAGRVKVFQRSAPYVIPKLDSEISPRMRRALRALPPLRLAYRFSIYGPMEFLGTGFGRFRAPLKIIGALTRRNLNGAIPEGPLREKLTPRDEPGCKRVLISSDWYPSFARENVDLETEPITEITDRGIRTADGAEHDLDAIVWSTGFKATEFLTPMQVRGREGLELDDVWREGASAHLGMAIPGFPNFFVMYGPNTNQGSGSMIFILEQQAAYITKAVGLIRRLGGASLEVTEEAAAAFDEEMQSRLRQSVWATGCDSWYLDESGHNSNNWPGTMHRYRRVVRRLDPADYVVRAPSPEPTAVA